MEQFILNGQIVNVDVQKTQELYKELPLVSEKEHCGCSDCAYYAKAIVHTTPAIQQFFEQFGIDPRKEAEVWRACENDDGTYYYVADYHFIMLSQKTPSSRSAASRWEMNANTPYGVFFLQQNICFGKIRLL